ncbi:peptide deformylase, partial [Caloranaerobacter azorensis]|uniref:peptide deformylase n=1 Tax=Caloranaerobacter azorensis TaxID=116090 RepID=UPI002589D98E
MAIRQLRYVGDPILRKKSREVTEINDRIKILLDDMLETMYKNDGVGLAAPQVGILKRVVVIDIGEGPIKLINPEIISMEGEVIDVEGCLSVPGETGEVKRPSKVKVFVIALFLYSAKSVQVTMRQFLLIYHAIDQRFRF